MNLKINWFSFWIAVWFIFLITMTGCKRVGSKIVLQDKDIQWEECSYLDGSGYLSVKKVSSLKKTKFYKYRDVAKVVMDMMIGNENELLASSFNSIESFIFLKDERVKHITLYKFPEGWFIEKLIGRVGNSVWVCGSHSTDEKVMKNRKYFLISVQKNQMDQAIPLTEVIGGQIEESHQGSFWSDVCGNIPYITVLVGKSDKILKPKLYLCYYDICKDKWKALEIPSLYSAFPMIKIGNKLMSLGDKELEVILDCEKQNSIEPIYSKRNFFWPMENNRYAFLYHYMKEDKENIRNSKAITKLMLYNIKTNEKTELKDVSGYAYFRLVVIKNTLVVRGYDQSFTKDLIIDLKTLKNKF